MKDFEVIAGSKCNYHVYVDGKKEYEILKLIYHNKDESYLIKGERKSNSFSTLQTAIAHVLSLVELDEKPKFPTDEDGDDLCIGEFYQTRLTNGVVLTGPIANIDLKNERVDMETDTGYRCLFSHKFKKINLDTNGDPLKIGDTYEVIPIEDNYKGTMRLISIDAHSVKGKLIKNKDSDYMGSYFSLKHNTFKRVLVDTNGDPVEVGKLYKWSGKSIIKVKRVDGDQVSFDFEDGEGGGSIPSPNLTPYTPTLKPWTADKNLVGMTIVNKNGTFRWMIIGQGETWVKTRNEALSYNDLKDNWNQLDGRPCGVVE